MGENNFEDEREIILENCKDFGYQLMKDTIQKNDIGVVPTIYASETALYSNSVRDKLRMKAETDIQEKAAEMIGYEVRERVRQGGMEALADEEDADPEEILPSGFALVDDLMTGIARDKFSSFIDPLSGEEIGDPEREIDPRSKAEFALEDELRESRDSLAERNAMYGFYVSDDDWCAYKSGNKPPSFSQEVVDYLEDIGVGNH